ncbi:hypothetical protein F5879DRAFT_977399 [Lentinula edodes]|nr:hypothetical protein F5879DRAFT_977399 [Lentinula edodes]
MAHYLSQTQIQEPVWLSPVDKAILQSHVTTAETEIKNLDSQIEKLTRDKDTQIASLAFIKNILTPVRRIPNEILSGIFEFVCHPDKGEFYAQFDTVRRTTVLSQVCAVWRRVAHDTSRIWSRLCLSIPENRGLFKREGQWVVEWLSRSRELPLELYLDFPRDNYEWVIEEEEELTTYSDDKSLVQGIRGLLNQILGHYPYLNRIRSLVLSGDPLFFTPLFLLPSLSLQGLERACMQMTDYFHGIQPAIKNFLLGSKLRYVEIVDSYLESYLETFMLPAEQLVDLQIVTTGSDSDFDPCVYADFLRRCSSLVRLDINPPSCSKYNSPSTARVSLPMLKSLSFIFHPSYDDEFPGVSILHILAVPLLEEMTLDVQRIELLDLATDMTALQGNSPTPNLKSLTLEMGRMHNDPDDLTSALALFPTITSLRLNGILFDMNPLFKAMTSTQSNVNFVLLPRIVNLELECRRDTAYPSELISMILSRSSIADAGLVSVLQSVSILQAHYMEKTDEDLTRIAELPDSVIYSELRDD